MFSVSALPLFFCHTFTTTIRVVPRNENKKAKAESSVYVGLRVK